MAEYGLGIWRVDVPRATNTTDAPAVLFPVSIGLRMRMLHAGKAQHGYVRALFDDSPLDSCLIHALILTASSWVRTVPGRTMEQA